MNQLLNPFTRIPILSPSSFQVRGSEFTGSRIDSSPLADKSNLPQKKKTTATNAIENRWPLPKELFPSPAFYAMERSSSFPVLSPRFSTETLSLSNMVRYRFVSGVSFG